MLRNKELEGEPDTEPCANVRARIKADLLSALDPELRRSLPIIRQDLYI